MQAAIKRIYRGPLNSLTRLKGQGPYAVTFCEIRPFLDKLSPADRQRFADTATGYYDQKRPDGRSKVSKLEASFDLGGFTVRASRSKGICPKTANGKVRAYKAGRGFVATLFEPASPTRIRARKKLNGDDHDPLGTNRERSLRREVQTALDFGPRRTDLLLGFGLYEDLRFAGERVGFAHYGLEEAGDIRMGYLLGDTCGSDACDSLRPWRRPLELAGRRLAEINLQKGTLLQFAHLGNWRENGFDNVRVLDLDTAVALSGIPRELRAAHLYLEIGRLLSDLYKLNYFPGQTEYYSAISLAPEFLLGYFRRYPSLSIVKMMRAFSLADEAGSAAREAWLRNVFGLTSKVSGLPDPKVFPLVGPRHALDQAPYNGYEVNLEDYCGHPAFAALWDGLQQVSASLI